MAIEVIVVGTDREADGRIWRNVQDGDTAGWIVATALRSLPDAHRHPKQHGSGELHTDAANIRQYARRCASATAAPSATARLTAQPARPPSRPRAPEAERVEVSAPAARAQICGPILAPAVSILQTVPDGTRLTVIGPDRESAARPGATCAARAGPTGWIVGDAVRSLATPSAIPDRYADRHPTAPTRTPPSTHSTGPGATSASSSTPDATAPAVTGTPTRQPRRETP